MDTAGGLSRERSGGEAAAGLVGQRGHGVGQARVYLDQPVEADEAEHAQNGRGRDGQPQGGIGGG